MRKGGTTLDPASVDAPPGAAVGADASAAPDPAGKGRWRSRLRVAGIAVASLAGVGLVAVAPLPAPTLRATSRGAGDGKDGAGIVGRATGQTVEDLQAPPPRGVEIYNAMPPPLVVIQSAAP